MKSSTGSHLTLETYVPLPEIQDLEPSCTFSTVVLKLEHASELHGGLVKTKVAGLQSQSF